MVLLLMGCTSTPRFDIQIDGYFDDSKAVSLETGSIFCVLLEEVADNPLLDDKIAQRICEQLEREGFKLGPLEEADWCLRFAYEMGTGKRLYSRYEPHLTGGVHYRRGGYHGWGYGVGAGYGSYVTYAETMYITQMNVQVFDARRFRDDQSQEMLWVGQAFSRSRWSDIRSTMACLLTALFDHFLEDTKSAVEKTLYIDDPRIVLLE
ncbi:MAG: DUF4136 domain-containing protein [Planctomycetota bacterium]|jgi:hypothetical protein